MCYFRFNVVSHFVVQNCSTEKCRNAVRRMELSIPMISIRAGNIAETFGLFVQKTFECSILNLCLYPEQTSKLLYHTVRFLSKVVVKGVYILTSLLKY